jgi:hypothetical protein
VIPDAGPQWAAVSSFANLRRAAFAAARGKRRSRAAARFLERCEPELLRLQAELHENRWRPGKPTVFTIRDPKVRSITAAPFRDRVVHHAPVGPLEPLFERSMVAESFACRKGKGTHKALAHAQALAGRCDWFLKLDIAKCFESIPHGTVMETLGELGLEPAVLRLCQRVLDGEGGGTGKGLPIGNLTSQWFANLVLSRMDRCVAAMPWIEGYARYMDDFLLCASTKDVLKEALARVARCAAELGLSLKERATILAPTSRGIPFLGWQVFAGTLRLRPENARRSRRRLKHRRWELRTGRIGEGRYLDAVRSVLVHAGQGGSSAWLRRAVAECCAREDELGSGSTKLRQPRASRREWEQLPRQREVGEPQRQHAGEPQQRQRPPPLQCIAMPDVPCHAPDLRG